MTEEMKQKDAQRFFVVNMETSQIVGHDAAEAEAKRHAQEMAGASEGTEFAVYQRVGSASLQPKVVWKGAGA